MKASQKKLFATGALVLTLITFNACSGPEETPETSEANVVFEPPPQESNAPNPAPEGGPASPVAQPEQEPVPTAPTLPPPPASPSNPGSSSNPGNLSPNGDLSRFKAELREGVGNGASVSVSTQSGFETSLEEDFSLNLVHPEPGFGGLAGMEPILQTSHLIRHSSRFRGIGEGGRLEGRIRIRLARHRISTYPQGPGVFQEPVIEEFFPVAWFTLKLRGCFSENDCQTLMEEIPFTESPSLACQPYLNSQDHCEGDFDFEILGEDLSEGNINDFESFKIEIQETEAAFLETNENQYQLCQVDNDCPPSHSNCVAGICSAIRPGTLLDAHGPGNP